MQSIYDHPKYYEVAFSFRDIAAEVKVFQEAIRRFSWIPVKRVLEIGCGNSPHMAELSKRGFEYVGIDLNEAMLQYARRKASALDTSAELITADMTRFSLQSPVDFAYVTLGSLYARSTAELDAHFDSVAGALKRGALYFLEGCICFHREARHSETWEIENDGIRINARYTARIANTVEQTIEERIVLDVDDHGERKRIVSKNVKRAIYPQEFLTFILRRGDFEFVGWWNNWDLSAPLKGTERITRAIAIVRRI
jgi:SAM-dependent methyltransferase